MGWDRKRAFLASLAFVACAACSTAPSGSYRATAVIDPQIQMPQLEQRIYALIEIQRHTIDPNAKALTLDPELTDLARRRSSDMALHDNFADATGDPHISATRLMADDDKFQGLLGENVAAQHYRTALGIDVDAFAERFVATWTASASHKENLSFADYDRTGVGAAINGDTVYVTQLFASDLPQPEHTHKTGPARVDTFPTPSAARANQQIPAPATGTTLRGSEGSRPGPAAR
jgi:uncharacterized protein YkwD